MGQWVRLCGLDEAPRPGEVAEVQAGGLQICLANIDGQLHALNNICPHREGPLGQGWVEGRTVVCPWHAWAFDVSTGIAEEPEHAQVQVYAVEADDNGGVRANLA